MKKAWFDNRSCAGYTQIRDRLDYLVIERPPKQDVKYETRVIKELIELIPSEDSRKRYEHLLEQTLKKISS